MNEKKKLIFAGAGIAGALVILAAYSMMGGGGDPSQPTAQIEAGATPVLRASEEPVISELTGHEGHTHP